MKLRSFRFAALLLAGLLLFSSVASAAAAPSLLDKLLEKKQEALQVDIGGIYYGSFSFTDCSEAYRPYEGRVYDAYMLVAADETGNGRLRVYLNQADPMFLQGSCRADGKSILVDEPLYFGETAGESLSFEPGKLADLYVANGSYALDGEGFSYRLCLRPYGALWEDAAAEWEYSLLLPPAMRIIWTMWPRDSSPIM